MRLIHTSTLQLAEFMSNAIPSYAILSHTWEEEEVSFQEMQLQGSRSEIEGKKGYEKIRKCCEIAKSDGFEYAWVDTCCIDKTSSSELSEAINSMWAWYKAAEVCYAYLSDVPYINELQVDTVSLAKARWWRRGWTLQELIAPRTVIFYSRCWHEIGTRCSLRTVIISTARIHDRALSGAALENFSIAQKMSWASARQTTRIEDLAYSMMGIFNVHMPMLYGEGPRAFFRLQEEIIKRNNDQTIFAWHTPKIHGELGGLLANSPAAFRGSYNVVRTEHSSAIKPEISAGMGEFSITNKGLLLRSPSQVGNGTIKVALDCRYRENPHSMIYIRLYSRAGDTRSNSNAYENGLVRKGDDPLHHVTSKTVTAEFKIRPLHVQTEFVQAQPTELASFIPFACLVTSARFRSFIQSPGMSASAEGLYFQPEINKITKFHFLSPTIGSFMVKVVLSFVWKKLRVEILDFPSASASELEAHGAVFTQKTWYSHPNPEDLATEPTDRIIWSPSRGTHLLLVAIRTKCIGGAKVYEIELDMCEKISSSQPGSPDPLRSSARWPVVQPVNITDTPKSKEKQADQWMDSVRSDELNDQLRSISLL